MCSDSFDVGGVGDNGDVSDRIYAFVEPHFDPSNLYRRMEVLMEIGILCYPFNAKYREISSRGHGPYLGHWR